MRHPDRYRFEVRLVDEERRVYSHVDDHPLYSTACFAADSFVSATLRHHVVWDAELERVLYDSRTLVRKPGFPLTA